jgi:hypothetical protein
MMRIVLAGVFLLGACAQGPQTYRELDQVGRDYQREQAEAAVAAQDTCGLANFRDLVGVHMDDIDRTQLPARARVITPDMMVTQDYSAGRLNVLTDTQGVVSSLRCF